MKLTEAQKSALQLIMRSNDNGDGWRTCTGIIFDSIIAPMPCELVEKDVTNKCVRLTTQGQTLVEWM